ncbi:hypothetical protein BT93_A1728 [Corymbia citriodora subsp. variegata]|nr:hypothetical protein BT93_A1728 [Corymbia citriodora subsp. variegata]
MGKNMATLSRASLKISKHPKKHQQQQQQQQQQQKQQQFNSLIKVQRPKVYITNTSCFKQLVQTLTGNGTSEHDDCLLLHHASSTKVITAPEVQDHHHHPHREGDGSLARYLSNQTSSDRYLSNQTSSSVSSDGVSNRQIFDETYFFEKELMILEHSTSNSDPMVDSLSPSAASVYSKSLSFSYEDLESWLRDMEMTPATPSCNSLPRSEPEVSIYDYELSGLL